jgi:hypothetical protein
MQPNSASAGEIPTAQGHLVPPEDQQGPQFDDPDVNAIVATIDAAVLETRADRAKFTDVWRATFSLPYWYFLAQRDEQGNDSLYIGTVDGHPHVVGFTTAIRLRNFAIHDLGVYTEDDQVPAAVMTPRGFVGISGEYENRGVEGIAFDHNINGHFTSMSNLKPLWEHCFGSPFDPAPDETAPGA